MAPKRFPWLTLLLVSGAAAGPRAEMLVSTDWLAKHAGDRNVVVLHVARERAHYDEGHLSGARFLPWSELVVTRDGVANELPPAGDLRALFERCGVSGDSRIVLYGDTVLSATRAWFTLDYLGHGGHAALLDGGLAKWRAEQRPVVKEEPPARSGQLWPAIQPSTLALLQQVQDLSWEAANSPSPRALILDVRPAAEFQKGHIPGAINVYWPGTLASKETFALRPIAELERIYLAAGVSPGRPVVVYCNSGVQATHTYFTLKYLGYDPALYDGSFSEWTRSGALPVRRE